MTVFNLITPATYWILIILWSFILVFYASRLHTGGYQDSLLRILFIILTIDAFRTLFENVYFGAWYTARAGLLPMGIHDFLVQPQMVIIPKLLNIFAAGLIIAILFRWWLPREGEKIKALEKTVQKQTRELSQTIEALEAQIAHQDLLTEALKKSEAKYLDLFENAPDMIALVNIKTNLMEDCNQTLVNTLGYTKKELIGWTAMKLYHPDGLKAVKKAFKLFIETGRIHNIEIVLKRKNGLKLEAGLSASAVRDNTGTMIYSRLILRDITERKQAEALTKTRLNILELSGIPNLPLDDLLRRMLDEIEALTKSTIGFYHFFDENQQMLSLQAWSTNTVTGICTVRENDRHNPMEKAGVFVDCIRKRRPVIHNDYTALSNHRGLPQGHAPLIREMVVPILRDSQVVAVIGMGNKPEDYTDHDVQIVSLLGDFFWEIVNRKIAETELSGQERKFRTMAENSPDNIARFDLDCRMIYINPRLEKTLGCPAIELIGKTPEQVDIKVDARQLRNAIARVLETGILFEMDFILSDTGNGSRYLNIRFVPEKKETNEITGVQVVGRDVTEQKRAEAKIIRMNRELEKHVAQRTSQLEAANKELEAFAYSVSHDLRAPLRHIDGFLKILQETMGETMAGQNRHYLDSISKAAEKMGLLIDNLLTFSRMGRDDLSFQPVDLENLVRNVIRGLEPDMGERAIEWHIDELPSVEGDAALLRMVMDNLIANAVKFTRTRQQARIEIGSESGPDGEIMIYIRDNGVGFDMAYADKLFGVFQRLHRADEFEGTGIGLANVHRIITRHGGRVWAEAKPDEGAVFYFTLPQRLKNA